MKKAIAQGDDETWLPIIARALAYLCLLSDQLVESTMLQKARFLAGLGFTRKDSAVVLGTTSASLGELERQAKKKGQPTWRSRAKKKDAA
jgi:hypothetical protein